MHRLSNSWAASEARRVAFYSMHANCAEFRATATAAVEFRSSCSWQVRNWVLAAINELIAAPRLPLTSDALASASKALKRSVQLELSADAAAALPGPSTHKRGKLPMMPTAKTVANKSVLPMRMTNDSGFNRA